MANEFLKNKNFLSFNNTDKKGNNFLKYSKEFNRYHYNLKMFKRNVEL